MDRSQDSSADLLQRAAEGDRSSLEKLFSIHRDRLRRIVDLRMDARIRGRLDASDVLQESALEAFERFDEFQAQDKMPFFVWLRFLTLQKLAASYRRHLGADKRDARREVRLHAGPWPQASSLALAERLIGAGTSPSRAAVRAEERIRLEKALDSMATLDREILAMRHFEQLTNAEAATALGMEESAASKRYVRALRKVRGILDGMEERS